MTESSDDEPIVKRLCKRPMSTAERYDAIARHRMKRETMYPPAQHAQPNDALSKPAENGNQQPTTTAEPPHHPTSEPFYQWDKVSDWDPQ